MIWNKKKQEEPKQTTTEEHKEVVPQKKVIYRCENPKHNLFSQHDPPKEAISTKTNIDRKGNIIETYIVERYRCMDCAKRDGKAYTRVEFRRKGQKTRIGYYKGHHNWTVHNDNRYVFHEETGS